MSGSVYTKLAVELSEMQAGMAKARGEVKAYKDFAKREGSGIGPALFSGIGPGASAAFQTALGAAGAAGIGALFKGRLEHYDRLNDTAAKLGESVEVIQRVGRAAELSDSSVDELASAMLKLEKNLGDPENERAASALEHFGLTAQGLMALPLDQKILALSDAFKQARASGAGVADLQDLLGKGSSALIPLISQEREEIAALFADVEALSADAVQNMADANDRIEGFFKNTLDRLSLGFNEALLLWELVAEKFKGQDFDKTLEKIGARSQDKSRKDAASARAKETGAAALEEGRALAEAAKAEDAARKSIEKSLAASAGHLSRIHRAAVEALPDRDKVPALEKDLSGVFDEMQKAGGAFYDASLGGLQQWADAVKGRIEAAKTAGDTAEQDRWGKLYEKILEMLEHAGAISAEIDKVTAGLRDKAATAAKEQADELEKLRKDEKERRKKEKDIEEQIADLTPREPRVPGSLAQSLNRLGGRSSGELVLDESRKQTTKLAKLEELLREIRDKDIPAPVVNVDGTPRF